MEPFLTFSRISSHERRSDMAGDAGRGTQPLQNQWFVVPGDVSAGDSRVFFSER
jgi:hypothetical protein